MPNRKRFVVWVFFLLVLFAACGQMVEENEPTDGLNQTGFQNNGSDKEFPDFALTEIFTGWGGLEEMWDSIETKGYNTRFTKTVDDFTDDFITFAKVGSRVLGDPSRAVILLAGTDAAGLLDTLIDSEENYPLRDNENSEGHYFKGDGQEYMSGFYAFLDEIYKDGEDPGSKDMVSVNHKIMTRLIDKKDSEKIHADMEELIEDILDDDFKDDFIDVTTFLGKLLARADYPQTDENGESLGIGNGVQGTIDLFKWYNRMEKNPLTRSILRTQVNELVSMFDPSEDSLNKIKIRKLLTNIEDYFTAQGSVYSDPDPANIYHCDNDDIYADAELGNTIRELFPSNIQLLMRSDRPHSLIADKGEESVYLLRKMVENLKNLEFDPETANIEKSINNLMQYDSYGRDRTDPTSGAHPTSHLENLVFLTHVTSNLGWQDRDIDKIDDTKPEVGENIPVVADSEVSDRDDARYLHGHGSYTGRLSLNDSLFSIKTHKTMNSLGMFDIGFNDSDGDDIYRSRSPFTQATSASYKFFFNQNYDVLQCLAPPCLGDVGSPVGGNPTGQAYDENDMNAFRAYSPDGLNENQLAAWTLGLIVRACFNGEGPYFYADPSAPSFMSGAKSWVTYLRPNGKVYAYVNKSDMNAWEYAYPAEEGEPEDPDGLIVAGKNQRYNRYKDQWQSDYYMAHYLEERDEGGETVIHDVYKTVDNSSGQLEMVDVTSENGYAAGRLNYREAIDENDPNRACSSPEEALFRNYQWFMTEKKMVLIIPLKIDLEGTEATIFQVMEGNGLVGLSKLRKFKANHYWAKAGSNGESFIPGDFRIEVVSSSNDPSNVLSAAKVYNKTLDCGHATPSVVGRNIQVLSRLGFPRYTGLTVRADGISDSELGSKEFDVGDNSIWNERCEVLPPFLALVSAMREYTPDYENYENPLKKGIRSFVEGTSPLLKPLIYYQKAHGGHPYETWKPRVYGSQAPGPSDSWADYAGDDFLRSSADFHDREDLKATAWDGTDLEKQYYLPAVEKSLLNVLIDSDIKADPDPQEGFKNTRMDGLLPLAMENHSTTELLKALLSDVNDSDLLYGALEQMAAMMKVTKGRMTEINETNVKNIDFPSWFFVKGLDTGFYGEFTNFSGMRDEDVVLDRGIDRLIGHDFVDDTHDGYGIAQYVDEQENEDWEDLYDTLDLLEDHLYAGSTSIDPSPYSLVSSSLDMNDAIFARQRLYTDSEISGLIYGLGKLMTHYDASADRWINQGEEGFDDLLNILRVRLPVIHELIKDENGFSGDHYRSALKINCDMLKEDGAVEFLVTTMETKVNWEQLMADSAAFLKDELVTEDRPLWSSFSDLLSDLATAVGNSRDGSLIESVYEDYGFQRN
ncbi:MAG: hypothetical protein KKD44_20590 [Proteobacteria bacterium]|nr:hypothetical protein [Pseudomonadota bacterium]